MDDNFIHVVFNPIAGGRRAGQRIEQVRHQMTQQFGAQPVIHVTLKKGDGFRIGHQLRLTNARLVVTAGGDGTINEVVNGLFRNGADIPAKCDIGILNFGSGGDFARGLGLPKSLAKQIELLANPGSVPLDLGLVRYNDANGEYQQRLFINEFQLGLGAKVVSETGASLKAFGGKLAYALSTVKNGLTYDGQQLNVSLPNGTQYSGRFLGLVIANGGYCGGGMQLTPMASTNDGHLNLLLIHEMSVPGRLINFTKIYSGKHIYSKSFTTAIGSSFKIVTPEVQAGELDGEVIHLKDCTVEIIPSALRVKALSLQSSS